MSKPRIAYIGLGIMGRGMVANLLKDGCPVNVWNRTASHADDVVQAGASRASSIAEAVADADVIMYCLSDDDAVREVVFGENGIMKSVRAGQTAVDMSTVHPSLSREQAQAYGSLDVGFLDAPVFGSKNEAANAGLWIVVGGERSTFERVEPILAVLSDTVHYMGNAGQGSSMKLVGNLVVAMQLEALGEAMVLASKAGLGLRDVLEVLRVTDFRSPIFDGVGPSLLERDFAVSFALKHMLKDANLIARFAQDLNSPTPALAAVRETIKGAVNQGWGEENASAMVKLLELHGATSLAE
jgi:3-hydroxyisobutyrate dehydrogenase-like beta-hydroxyacid dehydrogenase